MKFNKAEIDALIVASPRTTAPLSKLGLSTTYQVRPGGSTSKMSIAYDIEASTAWWQMDGERSTWADKPPQDPDVVLGWLLEQDQAVVLQLLTFLVASAAPRHLRHPAHRAKHRCPGFGAWSGHAPLVDCQWPVLPEPCVQEPDSVVTEMGDSNAAAPLAALKKEAAVAGADQAITGFGWLPKCLHTMAPTELPDGEGGGASQGAVNTQEEVAHLPV